MSKVGKVFRGKHVVITGAASGIGRSLAEHLLKAGAQVWAVDIDETALRAWSVEARKKGQKLHPVPGDVTQLATLESARRAATPVDYWINNAGISGLGEFRRMSPAAFQKVIAINLDAVVNGSRIALEEMDAHGKGRIVNLASVAGHLPPPFMTAYAATKHAVVGFTRALREEMRLSGCAVKVSLVSPGFVNTAILAKGEALGFPKWLDWALVSPEKVAQEILTALARGEEEIFPTWNGRLMLRLYRHFPRTTVKGTKLLLARSFKDWLLNHYPL